MGFCTDAEHRAFMRGVVSFEQMLIDSGIQLIKYYLDIDREEQRKRLETRKADPLKQWKVSLIDSVALQHWDEYTVARDSMLKRTDHSSAPWVSLCWQTARRRPGSMLFGIYCIEFSAQRESNIGRGPIGP